MSCVVEFGDDSWHADYRTVKTADSDRRIQKKRDLVSGVSGGALFDTPQRAGMPPVVEGVFVSLAHYRPPLPFE